MQTRHIRTKFNCRMNILLDDYFANEELMKQMPFKKFSLVSLKEKPSPSEPDSKIITRRFRLNPESFDIPSLLKSYLEGKTIEWEERVLFNFKTQTGVFSIEPLGIPNIDKYFSCAGEVVFAPFNHDQTERIMKVDVNVNAPFILKGTIEKMVLHEIWLMVHHEAEVVNNDLTIKE